MQVSCPNVNQSVGGTSAMAASLPDASGSCLATVSEPATRATRSPTRSRSAPPVASDRGRRPSAGSSTSSAPRAAALLAFAAVPAVLVIVVGDPLAAASGTTGVRVPRDACASWSWRPGSPGSPAAPSSSARSWRTYAAGEVGAAGRRRLDLDRLAARIAVRGAGPDQHRRTPGRRRLQAPARRTPVRGHPLRRGGHRLGLLTPTSALALAIRRADSDLHGPARRHALEHRRDATGDGADWTAIAALNLGRDMADGARFVDPDHHPGWLAPSRLPGGDPAPTAVAPSRTSCPPIRRRRRRPTGHLPELVALGLGSAGLRRAGPSRPAPTPPGRACSPAIWTSRTVLSERGRGYRRSLLQPLHGVPRPAAFEAANCLLGSPSNDRRGPAPASAPSACRRSASTSGFAGTG